MAILVEGDMPDAINDLPDDLVRRILNLLSTRDRLRVESVCKAWRKSYEDTWLSISLSPTSDIILRKQADWLAQIRDANKVTNLEILPDAADAGGRSGSTQPHSPAG